MMGEYCRWDNRSRHNPGRGVIRGVRARVGRIVQPALVGGPSAIGKKARQVITLEVSTSRSFLKELATVLCDQMHTMRNLSKLSWVYIFIESFLLVLNAAARAQQTTAHHHRRKSHEYGTTCGLHCGTERWPVKTLSDRDRGKVNFTPEDKTVDWLVNQTRPRNPPEDSRISPIETQVFQVTAKFVGFKQETDHDFHIVIADLQHPDETMVVEIADSACGGACASGHTKDFDAARQKVVSKYGQPARRFRRLGQPVKVTVVGVGFFDFKHGQTGVAKNAIELHPVLNLDFQGGP
jgi:hypothetical protein